MDCSLQFRHLQYTLDEQLINVHVLDLKDSFVLWVNPETISMPNLAIAMENKYENGTTAQNIFGDNSSSTASMIASRLCKKTGKQVFVSYNLPEGDNILQTQVEKRLYNDLIKNKT